MYGCSGRFHDVYLSFHLKWNSKGPLVLLHVMHVHISCRCCCLLCRNISCFLFNWTRPLGKQWLNVVFFFNFVFVSIFVFCLPQHSQVYQRRPKKCTTLWWSDQAWTVNPWLFAVSQSHLCVSQSLRNTTHWGCFEPGSRSGPRLGATSTTLPQAPAR